MSGILYVMIGFPGSGKTTIAKQAVDADPNNSVWVSRDEIRYTMVSDQEHYFDKESEVYNEYCKRISKYLYDGKDVYADATHLTHGSRKKLLNKITVKPTKIIGIWVATPFNLCYARNAVREGIVHVPDQSMYRMKNSFQAPSAKLDKFDILVMARGY